MWFEKLTGFAEESPEQVRRRISLAGEYLTSQVNGRRMRCGTLEMPSLAELRIATTKVNRCGGELRIKEVVADVQQLHSEAANVGAMFQVASQFNLLEMIGPHVTPERGVGIYEDDPTQGPACAIACGAATIYRNYFVKVGDQRGQTEESQIDCLADVGAALGNVDGNLWEMKNGYALASESGLRNVAQRLQNMSESELDDVRRKLRVGIQSDTEVTIAENPTEVSQVFCSALPVAYSSIDPELWRGFAILLLESAYEATFHAAVLNAAASGSNRLFLTLLGGGAFGNRMDWIIGAIRRSLAIFRNHDLDIQVVSYGCSQSSVAELITEFNSSH